MMCQIIGDFKMSLIEDGKNPKTIESYVGDIKEIVVENSKDRIKIAYGPEKQVDVYTDKEVDRMLFYIQNEEKVSKRNKVIVMLLLYSGVRGSELCSIKIKDIEFLNYSIKIYGKGGKFREVPLKLDLADAIREYIKDRDYSLKDSKYLVIGQRGALKRDVINTMLERLTDEVGMVNKLKPHTFRHTFCTSLINTGATKGFNAN